MHCDTLPYFQQYGAALTRVLLLLFWLITLISSYNKGFMTETKSYYYAQGHLAIIRTLYSGS